MSDPTEGRLSEEEREEARRLLRVMAEAGVPGDDLSESVAASINAICGVAIFFRENADRLLAAAEPPPTPPEPQPGRITIDGTDVDIIDYAPDEDTPDLFITMRPGHGGPQARVTLTPELLTWLREHLPLATPPPTPEATDRTCVGCGGVLPDNGEWHLTDADDPIHDACPPPTLGAPEAEGTS